MGIIAKKLRHIIKFDLNKATEQAISRNKTKIVNMNKQQLNDGLKADGTEMPPYSETSLQIKRIEGVRVPQNQKFSLKHKGTLHAGMFVNPNRTYFDISSSDPMKTEKLTDQRPSKRLQDKDAFGLTPHNKEVLCDQILLPFYQLKLKG